MMKPITELLAFLLAVQTAQALPRSFQVSSCNVTTAASPNLATQITSSTPPFLVSRCQIAYPAELRVMNSRYPDYDMSPLHAAKHFFMALRQRDDTFKIGTQVQFQGLPSNKTNTICRLEFIVPTPETQRIQGPNPSFNVYQVEREAGTGATWKMYEGGDDKPAFGQVNGEKDILEYTRQLGGALVNETVCNETMTFQMGMAFNGGDEVNYWDFINVAPPGSPVQGFRMVYDC